MEQQQWRNGHCYLLDGSSQRFCVYTACISCASISHLAVIRILLLNQGRMAHASFSVHTIVHHTYQQILIQNPCPQKLATNTTTQYKTTALLHTNNHEQCQKDDDEPWQATKQQVCQKQETSS
jgi:hypothetical protein